MVAGKDRPEEIDPSGVRKLMRLLDPLRASPAGSVIHRQVEAMLEEIAADHLKAEIAYSGFLNVLLESYLSGLTPGSSQFVQLKLLQARLQPPLTHSELIILGEFISELGAEGTQNPALMNFAGFVPSGLLIAAFGMSLARLLWRRRISILAAVHYAQPGDVVVVTNKTDAVALIGDIIGGEAHHKGLAGFVIDGRVRDTVALLELDLTVVCRGAYPVGPLKLPDELKNIGQRGVKLRLGEATVHPGDWVFADADGVIFVAAGHLPALYEQAEQLLEREENLVENMKKGTSLSEMVALESFLKKRDEDPNADFNAHLAEHDQTI